MATTPIFSADSHTMEPADLWVQRMDRGLRDRAPRVVKNYQDKKGSFFVAEGLTPFPVGGAFAAGKDPKDLNANQSVGYEDARPSGWDPIERLKDQDIDGVEGEVLYTTLGMFLFHLKDLELQWASFRAYNIAMSRQSRGDRLSQMLSGTGIMQSIRRGIGQNERLFEKAR